MDQTGFKKQKHPFTRFTGCFSQIWILILLILLILIFLILKTAEKESVLQLFWSAFFPDFPASRLNTERNTPYLSVFSLDAGKSGKNADQNNSEYGLFLPCGNWRKFWVNLDKITKWSISLAIFHFGYLKSARWKSGL